MYKTCFRLDRDQYILQLLIDNDPNPVPSKRYDSFTNHDGSLLVDRDFAEMIRSDDGKSKLYLIMQTGRDYHDQIVYYKHRDEPLFSDYGHVLETFLLEGKTELYFALAMYLIELGAIDRTDVMKTFERLNYPPARAQHDLYESIEALRSSELPIITSPHDDVLMRTNKLGVTLSDYDVANLKIIGQYLDSLKLDGNQTNSVIYALQMAAQVAKMIQEKEVQPL